MCWCLISKTKKNKCPLSGSLKWQTLLAGECHSTAASFGGAGGSWHCIPSARMFLVCLFAVSLQSVAFIYVFSLISLGEWYGVLRGGEGWTKGWLTSAVCYLKTIQIFKLSQVLVCKSNSSLRRGPAVLPLGLVEVQGPPCFCQQGRAPDFQA